MANEVYANGMEIACKAGAGKTICAFPDVCFTPPENPATPPGVPVPYPNTGFAKDATKGSKNVKISNEEIMLKNKSYFKTSVGDEAGCAAKKGVISSTNKGKVYFIKWSSNVKVEGENVDRHLDMTTNNHGSPTTNEAIPWTFSDRMAEVPPNRCGRERTKVENNCTKKGAKKSKLGDKKPNCPSTKNLDKANHDLGVARNVLKGVLKRIGYSPVWRNYSQYIHYMDKMDKVKAETNNLAKRTKKNKCQNALRCFLAPYNDPPAKSKRKVNSKCCPGQTGHHLIPKATVPSCCTGYDHNKAPVVCVEGKSQNHGTHKTIHDKTDIAIKDKASSTGKISYPELRDAVYKAMKATFGAGCTEKCIHSQLDKYYKEQLKCSKNCKFKARDKTGAVIINSG